MNISPPLPFDSSCLPRGLDVLRLITKGESNSVAGGRSHQVDRDEGVVCGTGAVVLTRLSLLGCGLALVVSINNHHLCIVRITMASLPIAERFTPKRNILQLSKPYLKKITF